MLRKILFVVVFSVYCFIFFVIGETAARHFYPGFLDPVAATAKDFGLATGFFLIIVVLAWIGANSVVYGRPGGQRGT
ncbi:MAG: hypothetical protein HS115_09450 [Spirochaetales bacterium]|nr:hypothetical protein [Spirochaetales bacterium]